MSESFSQTGLSPFLWVAFHHGSHRERLQKIEYHPGKEIEVPGPDGVLGLRLEATENPGVATRFRLTGELKSGRFEQVAIGFGLEDAAWGEENYVLIPGAVYEGNRFHSESHNYPPPLIGPGPGENPADIRIIDLPRLRQEPGDSHLDQLSIDATTPGIGIYFPQRKRAIWLLTPQECSHGPINLEVIESADRSQADILLGAPGIRHDNFYSIKFRQPGGYAHPSTDQCPSLLSPGEKIELKFQVQSFDCQSRQGLFHYLFEHRADCFTTLPMRKEIPWSETERIILRNQNQSHWREAMGLYQTSILGDDEPPVGTLLFQTGWCGGVINTLPMLVAGDAETRRRCLKQLAFVFEGQAPSGYWYPYFNGTDWTCNPGSHNPNPPNTWTLTRRAGDTLYFLARQLLWLRQAGQAYPENWDQQLSRLADALVKTWRDCGELGQHIDVHSGKVAIRGTASGALVPAALMATATLLDRPELIPVAEAIADFYRGHDLTRCVTTGGPGDAAQAPDSESICQLLESFIALHDHNGDPGWLQAATDAAEQAASWAMSYNYKFPAGSAFSQIDAQTCGAWMANAQNKTGVPGICTLSGQGFLRLYRASGDWRILEFLKEVSHSIPQYMGRADKAIPCSFSGGNNLDTMPEGWICERVNVTQWGEPIGELFAYSTWCEIAMLLVCIDLPGIVVDTDSGRVCTLDHVEASWDGATLTITNPTAFPAQVRILIEDASQRAVPLSLHAAQQWPVIAIDPAQTVNFVS